MSDAKLRRSLLQLTAEQWDEVVAAGDAFQDFATLRARRAGHRLKGTAAQIAQKWVRMPAESDRLLKTAVQLYSETLLGGIGARDPELDDEPGTFDAEVGRRVLPEIVAEFGGVPPSSYCSMSRIG